MSHEPQSAGSPGERFAGYADIGYLITREVNIRGLALGRVSHLMYQHAGYLYQIVSGERSCSPQNFLRFVDEWRITADQTILRAWLVAYIAPRLGWEKVFGWFKRAGWPVPTLTEVDAAYEKKRAIIAPVTEE